MTEAAARRGIRIATYSRGGYGGSTRSPARAVAQEARNTAALADHLGIATFHVVGWSGGGSSALACAALLPERVRSCVVLAGSSPRNEVGPEWFGWHDAGYDEELRTFAFGSPETYRQSTRTRRYDAGRSSEDPTLPDVDRETLARRPDLADAIADSFRQALAGGVDGWMDDAMASPSVGLQRARYPRAGHDPSRRARHLRPGRAWTLALGERPARAGPDMPGNGHVSIVDPFEPVVDALLPA